MLGGKQMDDDIPIISVDIEVGTGFDVAGLPEEAALADIDFGVSNGLNADRILKFITDLKADTLASLRSLLLRLLGTGEIKGLKITLNGVEVGSAQSTDLAALRQTITETLDELARHKYRPK